MILHDRGEQYHHRSSDNIINQRKLSRGEALVGNKAFNNTSYHHVIGLNVLFPIGRDKSSLFHRTHILHVMMPYNSCIAECYYTAIHHTV